MLCVLALALTAGGCGRRGKLEPPPDPNNPFALGTPSQKTADDEGNPEGKAKVGSHRKPKNPPIARPNEPFLLDPLL